jgi:hypothetical protein
MGTESGGEEIEEVVRRRQGGKLRIGEAIVGFRR